MRRSITAILFVVLGLTALTMSAFGQTDGDNKMFGVPVLSRGILGTDSLKGVPGRGICFVPGDNNQDLDKDGLAEIVATADYTEGGRVYLFEQVAKNSLQFKEVWASKTLKPYVSTGSVRGAPGSIPRIAQVGDLDGDGKKEIIFTIGYTAADTVTSDTTWARGLYIYQWDGVVGSNNYGTSPTFVIRPEQFDTDTKNFSWGRVENGGLLATDVDGDGKQELLVGSSTMSFNVDIHKNSGAAWILQVQSGTFAQGNAKVVLEYKYTKMAVKEDQSDGYAPSGLQIADVDGDGKKEIVVFGRTITGYGGSVGFIKVDGPGSYSDGGIVDITGPNGNNVWAAVVTNGSAVFRPQGQTADVVVFNTEEVNAGDMNRVIAIQGVIDINLVGINNFVTIGTGMGYFSGTAVGDQDHGPGKDGFDIYVPGLTNIWDMEYKGSGDIFDSLSYTKTKIFDVTKIYKTANGAMYTLMVPPSDINGNGRKEIIANWQVYGPDTTVNGLIPIYPGTAPFWVIEWGDTSKPTVDVKQLPVIFAEDYQLQQNYPNPFNPSTSIRFSLPIDDQISLVVYDISGREVKTLIGSERYRAGRYDATWDGKDNFGRSVASGTYVYELRYGNFTKTMKMTLLK